MLVSIWYFLEYFLLFEFSFSNFFLFILQNLGEIHNKRADMIAIMRLKSKLKSEVISWNHFYLQLNISSNHSMAFFFLFYIIIGRVLFFIWHFNFLGVQILQFFFVLLINPFILLEEFCLWKFQVWSLYQIPLIFLLKIKWSGLKKRGEIWAWNFFRFQIQIEYFFSLYRTQDENL